MSEEKNEIALVTLPSVPAELEAAFINDEFIEGLIKDIREKASSVVGDLNTVKGRRAYISMAANVRSTKTAIDEAGKTLVAEMKKRPALVDASRKKVRDSLDELAVEIRKPVTDWEAEQKEKEFNAMWDEALELDAKITAERAAALAAKIESDHEMALLMNEKFDRDAVEAKAEKERKRIAYEEELKRLAENAARLAMEQEAQREREESAHREAVLKAQAEQAERDRIEAEQRAEREKKEAERIKRENEKREQARLAEEKRIKDEEARRAANIAHQKKINNAAMAILMSTGLSEAAARECVCAIVKNQKALAASGQRPPISINY